MRTFLEICLAVVMFYAGLLLGGLLSATDDNDNDDDDQDLGV
jgi:hypothetical protein